MLINYHSSQIKNAENFILKIDFNYIKKRKTELPLTFEEAIIDKKRFNCILKGLKSSKKIGRKNGRRIWDDDKILLNCLLIKLETMGLLNPKLKGKQAGYGRLINVFFNVNYPETNYHPSNNMGGNYDPFKYLKC